MMTEVERAAVIRLHRAVRHAERKGGPAMDLRVARADQQDLRDALTKLAWMARRWSTVPT